MKKIYVDRDIIRNSKDLSEYDNFEVHIVDYGHASNQLKIARIYKQIDEKTGNCTEDEREFIIGYMKSGYMSIEDMDDYEYIKDNHPSINLPEIDF